MNDKHEDQRYQALKRGLAQLDDQDLQRVLDHPQELLLLDGGNWSINADGADLHCPLAVALGINTLEHENDDETVGKLIGHYGRSKYGQTFVYNQLKGTPGSFYRERRYENLLEVAHEVLSEREKRRESST